MHASNQIIAAALYQYRLSRRSQHSFSFCPQFTTTSTAHTPNNIPHHSCQHICSLSLLHCTALSTINKMATALGTVGIVLLALAAVACLAIAAIFVMRQFKVPSPLPLLYSASADLDPLQSPSEGSRAAYNNPFADPDQTRPSVVSWLADRFRQLKLRSSRTAAGAYEGDTRYRAYPDDDAWDTHVGREADGFGPYDEEHEMGAVGGARRNGDLGVPPSAEEPNRAPSPQPRENPFGDDAEPANVGVPEKKKEAKRKSVFIEEPDL